MNVYEVMSGLLDCMTIAMKNIAEELKEYRAIGTVEECREAVEKQTAKLVINNTPTEDRVWYQCPTCKGDLTTIRGFHCAYCGQKLNWNEDAVTEQKDTEARR